MPRTAVLPVGFVLLALASASVGVLSQPAPESDLYPGKSWYELGDAQCSYDFFAQDATTKLRALGHDNHRRMRDDEVTKVRAMLQEAR